MVLHLISATVLPEGWPADSSSSAFREVPGEHCYSTLPSLRWVDFNTVARNEDCLEQG